MEKGMAKTVVHLVYSFDCGGLEKVIVNLANHSADYPVKHVIVTLTPQQSMFEQIRVPAEIFCLNKPPGNDIGTHRRLYQLLKQLKPHVLHTYNFGTIEYHFTAWLAKVPVRVHCDHGRGGDDPKGENRKNNMLRRFLARFIHHYVVVSYDLYDWVTGALGLSKDKVSLIFNGVSLDEFACPNRAPHQPYRLCTIGRADKVKNQRLMIDAFVKAWDTTPAFRDAQLDIVGDGPEYASLCDYIKALPSQYPIQMLGFRSDIPEQLAASDAFVLSSVYEAMPMTILESMASHLPVICTQVGGIGHFVSENEVWFVPTKNVEAMARTMVELRTQDDKRQQKVQNGYRLVKEKYSLDAMVKQYMALYRLAV
ncbi:MAG: group 1 glycosyl transferase [Kangiellaceae bacterium]|nr:group 1 glycosyl transferase [Kangiellaceae bacterium]